MLYHFVPTNALTASNLEINLQVSGSMKNGLRELKKASNFSQYRSKIKSYPENSFKGLVVSNDNDMTEPTILYNK